MDIFSSISPESFKISAAKSVVKKISHVLWCIPFRTPGAVGQDAGEFKIPGMLSALITSIFYYPIKAPAISIVIPNRLSKSVSVQPICPTTKSK
jgi:hypothetical protein